MSLKTENEPRSSCIELEVDRQAVRKARHFVIDTLESWGHGEIADEVALAVSELVTNAVVHARSATKVTLVNHGDAVQLRVHDEEPESPTLKSPGPEETGGRGILMVEALCSSWGIDAEPPGKTVWLDISRT